VESKTQVEALKDSPFVLNQRQPVPPYFRAAYQRKALIVFEFFKEGEDPFYPQGLEMDDIREKRFEQATLRLPGDRVLRLRYW
jgi:hypothetical protein